jgi:hypothetical protein
VVTADEPVTEGTGTVVGPYKLLEQIGEGGFGVVFMAEQTDSVRRKVALKVLKPGMDTRQVIARFEAERQALAIMDHPNIAKVYDGGASRLGVRTSSEFDPIDEVAILCGSLAGGAAVSGRVHRTVSPSGSAHPRVVSRPGHD